MLKLKCHFELAAGMQETVKAQKIALKMKKCIFEERNHSILDLPSFEKLQRLLDLISSVCLPLAEGKKEEKSKATSVFSFSTPQRLVKSK